MNADIKIHALFAQPVFESHLDRQFTKSEIQCMRHHEKHTFENEGNRRSLESYVLNKKPLRNLKKLLEEQCRRYLEVVISPAEKLQLYITQSWFNYTSQSQHHHLHSHSNSYVSGVLYFDATPEDSINFYNPVQHQTIMPEVNTYNVHNATQWWFPIRAGQLMMFPSNLVHGVNAKKGSNIRTSLAFNTFVRGVVGSHEKLSELKL